MGTRSFTQVAPTPTTMAMNAYIFGYAGHSLVTPHVALKQLWWTEERINAKVTRNFVLSKLRGEEREFLERPLAFGEGLTDHSYMEWILERARRLFLILTEIGVPDQIFGCIDDSWDDDDLPIPLEDVPALELSIERDDALNKKFYDTQFVYLLRELQQGTHIDYGPKEHIPMEYVNTVPPAVSLQVWDRVHFPDAPNEVYMRRKYSLVDKETGRECRDSFMRDIQKAQRLGHEHIACVWASYTAENSAYIISDFVGEHTLATFIDHRVPTQYQRVPISERPALLAVWMHCLADCLASLHHRGAAHTSIRPSNILINRDNRIAFADVGSLRTFQRGKKVNKVEIYDYAAPESQLSSPSMAASSPPVSSAGVFNKLRNMSTSTSSSSDTSSGASSIRSNSLSTITTTPLTPVPTERTNSITASISPQSPKQTSSRGIRNFSRHLTQISFSSSDTPPASRSSTRVFPQPTVPNPDTLRDLPEASPQMSDIYSLGCVFLDIITFMLKGKTTDFVKFRTTRLSSPQANNTTRRPRNDTSFHSDPEKILEWLSILHDDSERHPAQIYRGIPELLRLIQRMLQQNAALRPTAMEVRDEVQRVLVDLCGMETLCCTNRDWNVPSALSPTTPAAFSPRVRDSMSIATGITASQSSRLALEGRAGVSRCGDHGSGDHGAEDYDDGSVLTRTESNATIVGGQWHNSAKGPAARKGSWRRAFSRSS